MMYPAMGMARYCWSVVVLLSEMMSRQSCWRPARNESTDGLARSENGSEFQSTMVRRNTCSSRFEE